MINRCRLKEFSEQREVDQYLSASGYLPSGVRPFFIALPKASLLCTMKHDICAMFLAKLL